MSLHGIHIALETAVMKFGCTLLTGVTFAAGGAVVIDESTTINLFIFIAGVGALMGGAWTLGARLTKGSEQMTHMRYEIKELKQELKELKEKTAVVAVRPPDQL